jgi:hypothetical protein
VGTKIQIINEVRASSDVRVGDRLLPRRWELHWEHDGPDAAEPCLHAVFEVIDGVPQCREVRVASVEGGREVIGSDTRDLRIEDWIEASAASVGKPIIEQRDGIQVAVMTADPAAFDETLRQVRGVRRARKRAMTPDFLREVASVYRANPKAPTKAVAEHFGVAHRTAALYVQAARNPELGLLGPAVTGKGGER